MKVTLSPQFDRLPGRWLSFYGLIDAPWKISVLSITSANFFTVAIMLLLGMAENLWVGLTISTISSGVISYLVGVIMITLQERFFRQQAQLEAQARDLYLLNQQLAQSNADLKAFAHTVAHDLKSPASQIVGFAEIARDLWPAPAAAGDEMGQTVIHHLLESSHRMVHTIDDLLVLASINKEQIQRETIEMNAVLDQIWPQLTDMIEKHGATINRPADWPSAVGYAPWLQSVWANYISNGLKYGGQPPQLVLGATPQGNMVRFWIRDEGPGIPFEEQPFLFSEFNRLPRHKGAPGHGLGLSIVKRIVEKLDGQVGLESAPGRGSVFYFTLPKALSSKPVTADS